MKTSPRTGIALGPAIALALGGAAHAQDEELRVLEEVVVTAQKRTENVQDVPMSISTLSEERIGTFKAAGDDIRFLRGRLPSLQVESSFGRTFPRFYIRGFGNPDFDLNASQPVLLVYDDVVQENPVLKGFPLFDMERVELLRGPQGTLFGRNTPAGIVKFDSRRPTRENEGYLRLGYGEYSTFNAEGAISGPLSQDWSARVSAIYQHRDDWVDNRFTGEGDALGGYDDWAVRAQFLYEGDRFTGLFNLHARDLEGTARLFRANAIVPGTNDLVPGFERDTVAIDGQNGQDLESQGAFARLTWDLGETTLTSITAYETLEFFGVGDIDGGFGAAFAPPSGPGFIPFPAETADAIPDHEQITQEFRLESNEWGAFDWQLGFFYFLEDVTIETINFDTLAGSARNGFVVQNQETDALAVFGAFDYEFSENLVLQGGLRYTRDEKEFSAVRTLSPIGAGPIGPLTANPDDSEWSGDLSLTYYLSPDVSLYGRVARGFRAPTIQGRILFGDIISVADSETVLSWEGGVKSLFWDNRARLNVSLFSYEVDDPQLTAVGGQANFNQLINAAESTGQGFELELETLLADNFIITAGMSYNDTEINDPKLAVAPCGSGCTVLDPAGPVEGTVLIDGNPLPQAPEWVFNGTARWSTALGEGELYVLGDAYWRDEVNFFLYESAEYKGPELFELGLRVGFLWDDRTQEIALWGRNITDEEEIVGGIDFNNLTGFVNEPRIWGLEYSNRF